MKIRNKLTIQFAGIVTLLLFIALSGVYSYSEYYRQAQFYNRLDDRISTVSKFFLQQNNDTTLSIDLNKLYDNEHIPDEYIFIYDDSKNLVFISNKINRIDIDNIILNQLLQEEQIVFNVGRKEFLGKNIDFNNSKYLFFAGGEDFFGFDKIKNLRYILIIILLSISFSAIFFGRYFATKSLNPIREIINEVDEISITKLNKRLSEGNGSDEIAMLAKTFNVMLERLEKAFKVQENFVANASHEIRTPLTLIQGQLEIALNKERSKEYYIEKLTSALEDIKRLSKISNQLILLANLNNDPSLFSKEKIRIDDIIWSIIHDFETNEKSEIEFEIKQSSDNDEDLLIFGDDILLGTAIRNIIENSVKYSNNKKVKIRLSTTNSGIYISLQDNGIGIPHNDLSNIFNAFYRAKNISSLPGNGIGLSIVSKIVEIHKGKVKVISKIHKGTIFTLYFRKV